MAYSGFPPPATSYSYFRSGPDLNANAGLGSTQWNTGQSLNPVAGLSSAWQSSIWHPFPHYYVSGYPTTPVQSTFPQEALRFPSRQSLSDMNPIPWLLSLAVVSSVQTAAPFRERFAWGSVDFTWPSPEARQQAVDSGRYISANNLPLGIENWNGRTFVTLPKWKPGIPATLTVIDNKKGKSPLLQPYPSWNWHREGNCNGLTSVFRISVDQCGRLWVLDSGVEDILNTTALVCPTQLVVFDLRSDKLLWRYRLPKDQVKEGSLFTNIVTDVRDGKCDETFVYITDVFRYGIVVYNWKEDRSWRISHNLFFPDPVASRYTLDNITFRWTDGVFGLALSPVNPETQDRTMFFHPMSSYREFSVPTSILRNNTAADNPEMFKILGEARGKVNQHSSASVMDSRGVLFFNLVTQNSVGCWDSAKPYTPLNIGSIGQDPELLNFPNDLKLDHNERQHIWVITNKLHKYLYTSLSPDEDNFRILSAPVEDVVKGTVCDPDSEAAIDLRPTGCIDDQIRR